MRHLARPFGLTALEMDFLQYVVSHHREVGVDAWLCVEDFLTHPLAGKTYAEPPKPFRGDSRFVATSYPSLVGSILPATSFAMSSFRFSACRPWQTP